MPAQKTNSRKQTVKLPATKSASKAGAKDKSINDQVVWRDATLARLRELIREADPTVIEEQKWQKPSNPAGVALWSHDGMICTGEIYKDKVKLTFAYGAALPDPMGIFNAPGTGATRRALDIKEGEQVDARAFKALVKAAVARNMAAKKDKKL